MERNGIQMPTLRRLARGVASLAQEQIIQRLHKLHNIINSTVSVKTKHIHLNKIYDQQGRQTANNYQPQEQNIFVEIYCNKIIMNRWHHS
jgi:hypothetical protein